MSNNKRLEKENILYRPDLDYDREYDTVDSFKDDSVIEDIEISPNKLEELKNKINGVAALNKLLPSDLKEAASKPFEAIQHVIGDIDINPEKLPTIEEIIAYNSPDPEIVEPDDEYPDSPFRDEEDPIVIKITSNNIVDIIEKEYEYDLVSIIDDYIDKLEKAMNTYLQNVLTLMTNKDAGLFHKLLNNYTVSTANISVNHKHLSDLITRSQIARSMKTKMYNKLFNIDKTITHIRMCKVGVQQRIRYYEASYVNNDSLDNVVNNRMLEASRKQYDQKYKQNFINLYKYLNSSVMVLTECLNQFINEAQAKIILHEKEGIEL